VSPADGQYCRLVEEVFQIRSGKARCSAGNAVQIHIVAQRLAAGMDLQYGLSAAYIRQAHIHLPVEAAGAQQGVIQNIGAVGGRHNDYALVVAEAVHLNKELVQGLLALVVSAAQAGTSLAAHGVDLIDEDYRGLHFFRLLKKVAYAGRAHADIKLHKVGAGNGQKLYARLAGHSLGDKRLAGARRAY
jgi:hypothetical protein